MTAVLLCFLALFLGPAPPQEDLAALRALVEDAELGDAERAALVQQLSAAEGFLQKAAELEAETRKFDDLAAAAPGEIQAIQAELDAPLPDAPAPLAAVSDVAAHEARVHGAEASLEAALGKVTELAADQAFREERARTVPPTIARLETELQELDEQLAAGPPPDLTGRVQRARLEALRRATAAERDALRAELASYVARTELLPKRQARWARRVQILERDLEAWNDHLAAAREAEAAQARARANSLARDDAAQHPAVVAVIEETRDLIRKGEEAALKSKRAAQERDEAREALEDLEQRLASLREKLNVIGLTDEMGRQLRAQYARLRTRRQLARKRDLLESEYAATEFQRIELADAVRKFDPEARKQELIEEVSAAPDAPEESALRAVVTEAVNENASRRQALLGLVTEVSTSRFEGLRLHNLLADLTEAGRRYAEERVLYVRSVEGARLPDPREAVEGALSLVLGPPWVHSLGRVLRDPGSSPRGWFLLLIGIALSVLRPRIARLLSGYGEDVRRYRTDRLALTGAAALATAALAAPKPMLLAGAGLVLASHAGQDPTVAALGATLVRVAIVFVPMYLLRALVRKNGLADAHLKWTTDGCRAVRRGLLWYIPLTLPLVVLALVFRESGELAYHESLGRPAAWGALAALGILSYRLLHRDGALLGPWLRRSDGIVARSHALWFRLAIAAPWALLVASAFGYHYTAIQFSVAYRGSLALVLAVIVGRGVMTRWRSFTRRRLAVEQARQRAQTRAAAGLETVSDSAAIDEEAVDIPAVDAQTRRLFDTLAASVLAVGMYLIWSGLLPALSVLDRVQVFPHVALLEESQLELTAAPGPDPDASAPEVPASGETPPPIPGVSAGASAGPRPSEIPSSVTLADILAALVFLGVTALLARNVPGVLEFAVLVRLPLDAGARYAVATLVRYVIVLFGLTFSMREIGIGWTSVQWLAAALTFGLAFGLQEIFANFVSGVILLLERPLRVGDFVTVDGVEGQVTRLRMRATTITDWDNRELLIPNKQFITTSIVNWTLTDSVTRTVLTVGVAYGSDVRRARDLLLEVARTTENVLDKPEPSVVFREFGDSSLTLQLRVYLPHREVWPRAVTALHLGVDDAFREAGIEIAFPQRDLHLRSVAPEAATRMRGEEPRDE